MPEFPADFLRIIHCRRHFGADQFAETHAQPVDCHLHCGFLMDAETEVTAKITAGERGGRVSKE